MLFSWRRVKCPPLAAVLLIVYIIVIAVHAEAVDILQCDFNETVWMRLLLYPLMIYVITLIWKTTTMDPGVVRKSCNEIIGATKFCDLCNVTHLQSSNTHHCRECNHCVEGFDHHCNILGVCIGKCNRAIFIVLLGVGSVSHMLLTNVACCRFPDSPWHHFGLILVSLYHTLVNFQFSYLMVVMIFQEVWENFWVLYFVTASVSLGCFFGLHAGMFVSQQSTLDIVRRHRAGDPWWRALATAGSSCIAWFHESCHIDYCLTNECMHNPESRWKVLLLAGSPYVAFAVVGIVSSSCFVEALWYATAISLMAATSWHMRLVVLSIKGKDKQGDTVDVRLYELYGDKPCPECRHRFLLNCHHCPLLGTCIHKHNRVHFLRLCVCCCLASTMLLPSVYQSFVHNLSGLPYRHRNLSSLVKYLQDHMSLLCGPTLRALFILLPWTCSLLCYAQESFYLCTLNMLYHDHAYRMEHPQEAQSLLRWRCPTACGTLICCQVMVSDLAVNEFQERVLCMGDLEELE